MNHAQTLTYAQGRALGDAAAAIRHGLAGAIRRLAETWRRERAVKHLEQLSDRALYDIGLHRSQIRSAVYEGQPWS